MHTKCQCFFGLAVVKCQCLFGFGLCIIIRNLPQFVIQVVYTHNTGSVDIFVFSAMLFSVLSALISVSQQMKHRTIYRGNAEEQVKIFYSKKTTFKMKIECEKFRRQHRYTHKLLEKIICSTLGIDNRGNIEVFYIISARNSLKNKDQVYQ